MGNEEIMDFLVERAESKLTQWSWRKLCKSVGMRHEDPPLTCRFLRALWQCCLGTDSVIRTVIREYTPLSTRTILDEETLAKAKRNSIDTIVFIIDRLFDIFFDPSIPNPPYPGGS